MSVLRMLHIFCMTVNVFHGKFLHMPVGRLVSVPPCQNFCTLLFLGILLSNEISDSVPLSYALKMERRKRPLDEVSRRQKYRREEEYVASVLRSAHDTHGSSDSDSDTDTDTVRTLVQSSDEESSAVTGPRENLDPLIVEERTVEQLHTAHCAAVPSTSREMPISSQVENVEAGVSEQESRKNIKEFLCHWSLSNRITHKALSELLRGLKECFPSVDLPSDARMPCITPVMCDIFTISSRLSYISYILCLAFSFWSGNPAT